MPRQGGELEPAVGSRSGSAFDVIIVGGGPAGSTLAWALARRGIRAVVLEQARFPREKVCGDFVGPRGLRVLDHMGCLDRLRGDASLPIEGATTFVDWRQCYEGPIPFYGIGDGGLAAHGLTIARDRLDDAMLTCADGAGAVVHDGTAAVEVAAGSAGVEVLARRGESSSRYTARLVVGADGANSVVARSQGLLVDDPTRTSVARRLYVELAGAPSRPASESGSCQAVMFYDESSFPGYGWAFPAADGRMNVGLGMLSETRARGRARLPQLFERFVERLGQSGVLGAPLEPCSRPIGGVVKMYGAAGPNHFDGGLLVGEAGRFVDPMTGEGITAGMESALLAAPVIAAALEHGDASSGRLSRYEQDFRAWFEPSMAFLDLCAAMLRNPYMARPWLNAFARGSRLAQDDESFARVSGSYFGGHEIRAGAILGQVWGRWLQDLLLAWPTMLPWAEAARRRSRGTTPLDIAEWHLALGRSMLRDPLWHTRWAAEVQRAWTRLSGVLARGSDDPRACGLPTPV